MTKKAAAGDRSEQVRELQTQLAEAEAMLERFRGLARHMELADLGIQANDVVVEHLIPAPDATEAAELCAMMRQQEGCLGARPLPPRFALRDGWTAQAFWEPPVIPSVTVLFGLFSSILPEGQEYRIVPAGLRRSLGIRCETV